MSLALPIYKQWKATVKSSEYTAVEIVKIWTLMSFTAMVR